MRDRRHETLGHFGQYADVTGQRRDCRITLAACQPLEMTRSGISILTAHVNMYLWTVSTTTIHSERLGRHRELHRAIFEPVEPNVLHST